MVKEKDSFKEWIQQSLEEEAGHIAFSQEMRERVRGAAMKKKKKENWLNRRISLSVPQLMVLAVALILVIGFYGKTFFYISSSEWAMYQTNPDIVVRQGNTPFGAVQKWAQNAQKERQW